MPEAHIDPSREQFDAFKALPREAPIAMLNLVRYRERAAYPDGHASMPKRTPSAAPSKEVVQNCCSTGLGWLHAEQRSSPDRKLNVDIIARTIVSFSSPHQPLGAGQRHLVSSAANTNTGAST